MQAKLEEGMKKAGIGESCSVNWPSDHVFKNEACTNILYCEYAYAYEKKTLALSVMMVIDDCPLSTGEMALIAVPLILIAGGIGFFLFNKGKKSGSDSG